MKKPTVLSMVLFAGSAIASLASASAVRPDDYYLNPSAPEVVEFKSDRAASLDRAIAERAQRIDLVASGSGCQPMSLYEYQQLIMPNPDANNLGCYEQYLFEMKQAFLDYLASTFVCLKPDGSWDCDCLAAKKADFMDRERDLLTWLWSGCQGPI